MGPSSQLDGVVGEPATPLHPPPPPPPQASASNSGGVEKPIWLRNIQLGLISLVLGLASVYVFDGKAVAEGGFFQGYTWLTLGVISQVSLGGLLVGLVMKYADNVVKGFATSLSIVISSAVSSFIPAFGFTPDPSFCLGAALVMVATMLYSGLGEKRPPEPSRAKTGHVAV